MSVDVYEMKLGKALFRSVTASLGVTSTLSALLLLSIFLAPRHLRSGLPSMALALKRISS